MMLIGAFIGILLLAIAGAILYAVRHRPVPPEPPLIWPVTESHVPFAIPCETLGHCWHRTGEMNTWPAKQDCRSNDPIMAQYHCYHCCRCEAKEWSTRLDREKDSL